MSKRMIAFGWITPQRTEVLVDERIAELEQLAQGGVSLPYPPAKIIAVEDAGGVVNLETGAIEIPIGLTPTAYGETIAHLMEVGLYDDEGDSHAHA